MYCCPARVSAVMIVVLGMASAAEMGQADLPAAATARRYIDIFELTRYREDLVSDQYGLLSQPVVQAELKISPSQALAIKKAWWGPHDKEIPGLAEFTSRHKEKIARPNLTKEERLALNDEARRGVSDLTSKFLRQQLREILDAKQRQRLEELLVQMRGPVLIVVDPTLASRLDVRSDQLTAIKNVISETDKQIGPTLAKFGRGFISGMGAGETEQSRDREMKEAITQLMRLIPERDSRILKSLTESQGKHWRALQGAPIQIQWDPWEFLLSPFEKKAK